MRRRLALAVLSCVAAVWLLVRAVQSAESTPSPPLVLAERAHVADAKRVEKEWPRARQAHSRASTPHLTTTDVHTTRVELEHAHPISERHEHLREQQALLGALNDALDLGDAAALRTLLQRYDVVQPEDPMRLAEGYERVADCIEARPRAHERTTGADEAAASRTVEADPGSREGARDEAARASVRANAQRYYDDARASSVRRYVRRYCLEESER